MTGTMELWFKNDLAALLASLERQVARYPGGQFREGYQAAIDDMRTMLSIDVPGNSADVKPIRTDYSRYSYEIGPGESWR